MMLETILSECDRRQRNHQCGSCEVCSYENYCPKNCENCLDYIHTPLHAPNGAPDRKYDCPHMADFYTCKYSCRYTSEIIYAIRMMKDLKKLDNLKVLSFGCGPCTDLFAIDYLRTRNELTFQSFEYRGIDYSKKVWENIHADLSSFSTEDFKICFFYKNACDFINIIANKSWVPNLIVFQYVFSDMQKHSKPNEIIHFKKVFSDYFNQKVPKESYIVLNDINLDNSHGGGRDHFCSLYRKLEGVKEVHGRFRNENSRSSYYPCGYPYGDNSLGEFPDNKNFFNLIPWQEYSPFNTCASAQMLIKKEV